MVKLFQCERNTFKNTRFSTGRKFVWCRVNVTIEALKLRKICRESQISQKVQWFPFHVLSVQMPKMFLVMKVITTAVLLTTVYLMQKGAYYLFIIIRSWKLVQSFTRDPSILTCSFKICSKNRMTYWVTLFRTDGSHFKLHIKGRGDGCHSSPSFFLSFFLSFSTLLAPQTNENYLFFQVSFWNLRSRVSQCNCRFAHILLSQLLN